MTRRWKRRELSIQSAGSGRNPSKRNVTHKFLSKRSPPEPSISHLAASGSRIGSIGTPGTKSALTKSKEAFAAPPRGVGAQLARECLRQQPEAGRLGQNVKFARSSTTRGPLTLLTVPVVPKLADWILVVGLDQFGWLNTFKNSP